MIATARSNLSPVVGIPPTLNGTFASIQFWSAERAMRATGFSKIPAKAL
jgi:hypothetical protein